MRHPRRAGRGALIPPAEVTLGRGGDGARRHADREKAPALTTFERIPWRSPS